MIWVSISPHIAKSQRYSLGIRIENKILDLLENSYIAYFTEKDKKLEKVEKISSCILILNILKYLVSTAWEGKLISNKQYEDVAVKLEDIGGILGGWKRSLDNPKKKNHTL